MKKITLLLFAIVALSFQSYAQDTCAAAVAVIPGTTTGTTITFGTGSAEMAPAGADSAWFVYSATADGTIDVSACGGGSDTDLSIGTGLCGSLTILDQNDDSCDLGDGNFYASELTGVVVAAGTDYYIEWSNEWEEGPFDWTLTYTPLPACGDATNVVVTAFDTNADFSWDAPIAGTPVGYNWEIQPNGVAQGTAGALASGTVAGTTVNSGAVLTAATSYEFYVQTDCNPDATANYATVGFLTASGPAPANDDFADAIAFACGDMNITSDTTNATLDEDDAPDGFGADNDSRNIWYSYTGSGLEEEVTIDLCASGYDTAFLVYTGTSGSLSIVGGNDDNAGQCGAGFRSYGSFTSDGTTQYFICVTGYGPANFGTIDMSISCVAATPPPANDLCSAAVELDLTVATNGTTLGATQNGTEEQPSCDGFGTIADVWYSIALTSPSDLNIVTTITGTSDQANVAVYSACGGLQADQLGCSDANGGETLAVAGLAAGTYYVRVWSDGSAARMSEANNRRTEGTFTITADATLSVGSLENENAFNYFPNPVKNELTLNAQKDIQNVAVYNMLGQEVLRTAPNSVNSTINMSELSQGAYFVQVTIGNVMETIRIIKQ
jgi:hypothetical protein